MEDSNSGKSLDRLSELPDSLLIFHIFKFLPIRDVVRTTILSKRWENLWNTVPYLNFHDDGKNQISNADRSDNGDKFIAWALMLWRGTKILNLKIKFGTHIHKSMFGGIDLLLRFAKEYEVEELDVDLEYDYDLINDFDDVYLMPQCLYSCSSLKRLYICSNYFFHIPIKNVKWDQLEKLEIVDHILSEVSIKKVLSGSPKLKILALLNCIKNNEILSIESSSLRELYVHKYLPSRGGDTSMQDTELRISTPNLERLGLEGVPYSKFVMNNAPCLYQLFWVNDFVGESLSQILPVIQHVKVLGLTDCCTKVLGDMGKKSVVSPFPNVGCLKLFRRIQRNNAASSRDFPKSDKVNSQARQV